MTETPSWALTASFWLHMLATVSWVGGQVVLSLIVIPLGRRILSEDSFQSLIMGINKQMRSIGWFSFVVLIGTGLIQIAANDTYAGFLSLTNNWGRAILIKLVVFGIILALTAYQTWGITPIIERTAILKSRGKIPPVDLATLRKREILLLRFNLALSIIVLFLTAIARINS
jgi:uncharacterized membrane protein